VRSSLVLGKMVVPAERERLKAEKEAEKQRIRAAKEAEKEQKRKEREALEAERELKKKEKEARKQQEEAEKEQRRREKEVVEAEKEQKRKERELKRQQEEAEKEQKRKEREIKRQQDEAEKEQKRKEKEAAERKKQLVLQKQATIMDRLFSRQGKQGPAGNGSSPSPDQQALESESTSRSDPATADVVSRVDEEFKSTCIKSEDELLRSHVVSWQEKWKCRSSEPFRRWGMRLTPKVTVLPELRLQGASMGKCSNSEAQAPSKKRKREEDDSLDECKLEDNIVVLDDDIDAICSPPRKKLYGRWKLLQFDKSHRPAYYGTFSKLSSTIRPRHPLRKEPSLDYEVDSDEEWEEEDPGESLSDCEDKEEDLEKIEPESDEEAADGFVVPDGYLSENEGVHLGEADLEDSQINRESLFAGESGAVDESLGPSDQMSRRQQQLMKVFDDVTKHALKRNRPFLASNLLQQPAEECTDAENRTERLCFEALRMCVVAPDIVISPVEDSSLEGQEHLSQKSAEKAVHQKRKAVQQKIRPVEIVQ
jgi:chromatin assembly factor 1 subunit A